MTVTLLYFAAVRDVVGSEREEMTLPAEVRTVADLAAHLEVARPALAGRLASVRFARNETFASLDEVLGEGDEVALIPPVAGG